MLGRCLSNTWEGVKMQEILFIDHEKNKVTMIWKLLANQLQVLSC